MQVQETLSEGLRREFRVVVPATELDAKLDARLAQLKDQVQINGFRPGKVPVAHLKRVYGRSVMAEAIDGVVSETNAKIVTDNSFRVATEPKVTLPTEETEVQDADRGQARPRLHGRARDPAQDRDRRRARRSSSSGRSRPSPTSRSTRRSSG